MSDINHQIGIKASPQEVYELLTTDQGLSQWWTRDTTGAGGVGSIIKFRFGDDGPDFEVKELIANELVVWMHSGTMPAAWMGTEVSFQLRVQDGQTFVRFSHANWKEPSNFMAHCSMKWAVFLLSLKDVAEIGKGRPFPNDIHIDHSEY